jgi:hypothetical protein
MEWRGSFIVPLWQVHDVLPIALQVNASFTFSSLQIFYLGTFFSAKTAMVQPSQAIS